MKLSLQEAATVLGKSPRQVRYLIKSGRLGAVKAGGRWRIESGELPLTDAQRRGLADRLETVRRDLDAALGPAAAAAEPARRRFSIQDLAAFQAGEPVYRAVRDTLGADDPACGELRRSLVLLACGCHSFHPADKVRRFTEAREAAATAVAELLLGAANGEPRRKALAEQVEQELIGVAPV